MRDIAFKSLLITGIITQTTFLSASYAQQVDNSALYDICARETDHKTLYRHGKELAEGWVYWKSSETKEGRKYYPVKTREDFFSRARFGYFKKYKIKDTDEFFYCFAGYSHSYERGTWSSVHQGLVDYLPSQSRSEFLYLPER